MASEKAFSGSSASTMSALAITLRNALLARVIKSSVILDLHFGEHCMGYNTYTQVPLFPNMYYVDTEYHGTWKIKFVAFLHYVCNLFNIRSTGILCSSFMVYTGYIPTLQGIALRFIRSL